MIRRASIAIENAVKKVKEIATSAFRHSSLQELYERAMIRQVQLKHRNAVQFSFEYVYYVLILTTACFVSVGIPLWNGLVLTTYYLFDMIQASTAIFFGIGFLYIETTLSLRLWH